MLSFEDLSDPGNLREHPLYRLSKINDRQASYDLTGQVNKFHQNNTRLILDIRHAIWATVNHHFNVPVGEVGQIFMQCKTAAIIEQALKNTDVMPNLRADVRAKLVWDEPINMCLTLNTHFYGFRGRP